MYGPLQAAGKFEKPLGVELLTVSANERFLLASSKLIFGVCKEIPIPRLDLLLHIDYYMLRA